MALHVIASPKGAAISFSMGLLRRSAPRNDGLFISFVLTHQCINLLRVIMKTLVRIASQGNYEAASGDHYRRPSTSVIPGLTRNPVFSWIPAFAGMTTFVGINVAMHNTSAISNVSLRGAE